MQYKWPLMKNTVTWADKWQLIKFIATSDRFTNGPRVKQFEREWDTWLGSKHSLYVTSGSTANLLLVAGVKEKYGLQDGDNVLVPACTWVTNISPIIQCKLNPVFCDINLDNYSFDVEHMEKIAKTRDIKMVFITHLLGFSADNEKIREIFPNALIIEDICESHGVRGPNGRRRGSTGVGSTFSFYFGHHMTTVEGGMISTEDEDLHDLMRIKRSHGLARELPPAKFKAAVEANPDIDRQFMFLTEGFNFRNNELCAVLGSSQLKRLDNAIDIRQRNFSLFHEIIRSYQRHFYVPANSPNDSSYAFPIVAKDKAVATRVRANLEAAGVETRPIVSGNLLLQPFLRAYTMEEGSRNNIQIVHENGVYVGNNHMIGPDEISLLWNVFEKSARS